MSLATVRWSLLEGEQLLHSLQVLWGRERAGTTVWAKNHKTIMTKKEGCEDFVYF